MIPPLESLFDNQIFRLDFKILAEDGEAAYEDRKSTK
jgi:hypothetical protein